MSKKKLVAILTLLCFMFTFMPVAAMAEGEAVTYEVATKDQLKNAVNEAKLGDIIKLTDDIDYGTDHLEIKEAITLDLGGKTLTTCARNYGLALKNENCIVTNGTLNHAGTVAAIKVWDAKKISDLEINVTGTSSSGNGIDGIVIQENSAGVELISNVKIYSTAGQGITSGIKTYNCGNATEPVIGAMENVTVEAKDQALNISAPCGTATDCSFKGGVSGIEIWIKGTYSATLDLVNCDVEGGTQAVYAHDEFSSNPDIENIGTLELTMDDDTTIASENGNTLVTTIARAENVNLDKVIEQAGYAVVDGTTTKYYGDAEVITETVVAKIGDTLYTNLQDALNAAAAGSGNVTVEILDNIDLTNVDWNPVKVSAPGYPCVTVNGNEKTITGLNDMLFSGTWAGKSGLIINDLTIKDSNIVNDKDDSIGTVGVGAFIGYPSASATITLNNCHLVDSRVEGGHWTGGLIGIAGGYSGNDGPVFMNLTIKDCSVTGSTIEGKGSAGAVIGHAANDAWTKVIIENTTVTGNTIKSTGSSTNKAGTVMGTIGTAGQPTTANGEEKTGGVYVDVTESGNTVTSNGTVIKTVYGRQGSTGGELVLTGGTYANPPINEGDVFAKVAEGYEVVEEIGVWKVEEEKTTPIVPSNPPATGSSGGGFSGKYNYAVNVSATGADVTLSDNYAVAGETVTITIDPEAGKQVDEVIVTDADGKEIAVTKVGDNKYTFTMPAGKVNVAVTTEAADYDLRIVLQINNKNIVNNNKTITNDVAPVIVGERTLVPVRVVTELLGGTADWDDATRTVTLTIDGKVLKLVIDQPIPGFGTSATIINDRTYVPVRYVLENLGANVEWIAATQQIIIEK